MSHVLLYCAVLHYPGSVHPQVVAAHKWYSEADAGTGAGAAASCWPFRSVNHGLFLLNPPASEPINFPSRIGHTDYRNTG